MRFYAEESRKDGYWMRRKYLCSVQSEAQVHLPRRLVLRMGENRSGCVGNELRSILHGPYPNPGSTETVERVRSCGYICVYLRHDDLDT